MSKNSTEVICKPLGASNKKPLVISSTKYKKILSTINADVVLKKEAEEEQRYKEYLKQGSDEMVAKWGASFKRTQEHKQTERKQKMLERMKKDKHDFMKIREKDERTRQEKIAKAHELIQKLKPGPIMLQSAAIQSETLKGRTVQRNITKEFEETLKKRTAEEQFQLECQAMPWIEEEQNRISNQIRRNNQYKAEINNAINEKSRKKLENCKKELVDNKIAQDICDQEIKAQIEKEQDMLKRKREALRKNALEAMVMVEQRKAREQIQETVEGKLMSIYNNGKQNIEKIKKAREVLARQDHFERNAINAQNLVALQTDTSGIEEERLRKDISTIQLQFTAQEQEKIQRSRQQKFARIQEYFRELKAQKEQKQRKTEETRLALANRLKNEEVNAAFEQQQREEKIKKSQEVRKVLSEQIEERKQNEAERKAHDKKCNFVTFEKDDKYFFDYADELVGDAVSKDRPLFPFVKAVQQYKKENNIDVERKLPPHLESHLRIGVKTPECENDAECLPCASGVRRYGMDELKSLNPYSPRSQ